MPSRSPTAHFLGLELATDQLRAAVVDEQLDLVGVESVDFDSELPDFQTHGGIFTTPGDAYTTPVEMWIQALDLLLQKLQHNFDLSKIKSVGGSAQLACVWWKSALPPQFLRFNDPARTIHTHLFSSGSPFSVPNSPVAQDTSTLPQALALEHALGGPEPSAARIGTSLHASLLSAHALRMRETQPDIWARTGRVTLASTFLCSLLLGRWAPTSESEACATGLWNQRRKSWDDAVCEVVAGSGAYEHAGRLKAMLGDVDVSGGGKKVGTLAPYYVERFGFSPDTIVLPFNSDYLSTYLSLCPGPSDAILSFGPMDVMLSPASQFVPHRLYHLVPHPAQDPAEKRRYISVLMSRNGDVPRALVRDMYTKSWSAFDRLVAIVPPGGSIGLDDKLFSFWHLQAEAHPFSHVKGIFRFETGVKTNEFRDLRANPRCLLESQVLSFRIRYASMRSSPLYQSSGVGTGTRPGSAQSQHPQTPVAESSSTSYGAVTKPPIACGNTFLVTQPGTSYTFDPYSLLPLPRRLLATGAAANFPSVVNLLTDVFNAPVFVPQTQLDSAHAYAPAAHGGQAAQFAAAHRNSPAPGFPSRAALGGAYVARWAWSRERSPSGTGASSSIGSFEDDIKRLLSRKYNVTSSARAKLQAQSGGSSPGPYLKHQRSIGGGLGADVLVEEDEEEEEDGDQITYSFGNESHLSLTTPTLGSSGNLLSPVGFAPPTSGGSGSSTPPPPRIRTTTGSSLASSAVSGLSLSPSVSVGTAGSAFTALTSPDSSGVYATSAGFLPPGTSPTGPGTMTPTDPIQMQQMQMGGAGAQGNIAGPGAGRGPGTGTGITPLTPVAAMQTADAEAALGWAKVAEPDTDAFLAYASVVPEYVRLEGLLVKALV